MKGSAVVTVGQTSQAGLQLLNVLVTLTWSSSSFNYDIDHERVRITIGDWHYSLETFKLGSIIRTHSLASLHAPRVRALITCTTEAVSGFEDFDRECFSEELVFSLLGKHRANSHIDS